MAGITDILNTARDALTAQSYGLGVTGQNVANVNTPGYARRRAELEALPLGDQSFGTVKVAGVDRIADEYTERRLYAANGQQAAAGESDELLGYLESLFDISSGQDIGSALNELFSSFSTLAADPGNLATRQQVIQRAEALVGRLNDTASAISNLRSDLVSQASQTSADINALAKDIGRINGQIQMAEGTGADSSDLRDKRDDLLTRLSQLVDVRTFTNGEGGLVVQASGTTLVEGANARALRISLDTDGTLRLDVTTASGASSRVDQFLSGGTLSAIFDAHDTHTSDMLAALDDLTFDVATQMNAQHQAGVGLDGSTGTPLFDTSGGVTGLARRVKVAAGLTPEAIAASATLGGVPGDGGNAIAMAQLGERTITSFGTRTPSGAYAAIVADIGNRKGDAEREVSVRDSIQAQLFAMRESVSGVSLDEEMVSLTKFQRAFQAASQVLTTTNELLDDLMRII